MPLAVGDPGRLAMLCGTLGVLVGVLCLLAGLLRLGFVANFLSKPVIVGFMHGLAVGVAVAQLPKGPGIKAAGQTRPAQVLNPLPHPARTNPVPPATARAPFSVQP